MKKKMMLMIIIAPVLAALAIGQGPVRPVPMLLNDIAIHEAVYYQDNQQYVDPSAMPEAKADLTHIEEEGYTYFYAISYDKDGKVDSYHIQAWKDRDCNNGGMMSYYIQEQNVLRYRCSTDGSMANEEDKAVE